MSKIRMNTEYRNKLFNRIKDVFEKEETQERQGFLEARENFNERQKSAFELARQVVERSYPMEDVNTLRVFKKKYGDPCDVVAKDKCFYFAHNEDVDEEYKLCVVYHLLSIKYNMRIRVKCNLSNESLIVPSVTDIFASADWYEREAYDLFGVLFEGHQDLRRILTDYGFIGHPFRKKFPLIGNTQVAYDPEQKKVVNVPVDIPPRTLVPKVIRKRK